MFLFFPPSLPLKSGDAAARRPPDSIIVILKMQPTVTDFSSRPKLK
jgi:hypothetical protein